MSSPSALSRLRALCADACSTTIVVFYRGEWCPFCTTWARGLSALRALGARLASLDARVVFVSSQPVERESAAAAHFGFAPARARGLAKRVAFINDPRNELADWMRARFGDAVVRVDHVQKGVVGDGVEFPNGMLQPGVVGVYRMFADGEKILLRYVYDSHGQGGVDGEDDSRPQACVTLRDIEQAHKALQCS